MSGSKHHEQLQNLEARWEKLKFLAEHFDPYEKPKGPEILGLIEEFELTPELPNPFAVTDKILRLLDQVESSLKKEYKGKNPHKQSNLH